jgi:hypothetical protein
MTLILNFAKIARNCELYIFLEGQAGPEFGE